MDQRLFYPATKRNKDCIAKVLTRFIPKVGSVLEVASGSGEHAVAFQKRFPYIEWIASDPDPNCRRSINAWIEYEGLTGKMPLAINLDVREKPWSLTQQFKSRIKCIVCINMLHVSSWQCTKYLFDLSRNSLKENDALIIYGPFKIKGLHTSQSNELFDNSLRLKNPTWGLRDLHSLIEIGRENCFYKHEVVEMPTNNLMIAFYKNN